MASINVILNETYTDVGAVTEPVTLTEVKEVCRISNTSEDTMLTRLITSCRQAAEWHCGLAFVSKTALVQLRNQCGGIFLPYGPVDVSTVVITIDGEADTTTDKYGLTEADGQAQLMTATDDILSVSYSLGYGTAGINAAFATVPQGVKDGILAEIAYRWANRSTPAFHGSALCDEAKGYLVSYCKKSMF